MRLLEKMKKMKIGDIFSEQRFSKIESTRSQSSSQNSIMKKKLKDLIENLKNKQSSYNNILVMDTSGPAQEDLVH